MNLRKIVNQPIKGVVLAAARAKWLHEKKALGLEDVQWELYKEIHVMSFILNHRFPNLKDGAGLNDKINWLKLFNQSQPLIDLSDKIKFKGFIAEKLGPGFTPKTLRIWDREETITAEEIDNFPDKFVIKSNHDSGGVFIADKNDFSKEEIIAGYNRIKNRLAKKYGKAFGEWHYILIEPKVFAEEYIEFSGNERPIDYKCHCSNGKVLWIQCMYGRGTKNYAEANALPDGQDTNLILNPNKRKKTQFKKPYNWHRLLEVASILSKDFPYVRVDLYSDGKTLLAGELTFAPAMGFHPMSHFFKKNEKNMTGERFFGQLVQIDRSKKKVPVFCQRLTGPENRYY